MSNNGNGGNGGGYIFIYFILTVIVLTITILISIKTKETVDNYNKSKSIISNSNVELNECKSLVEDISILLNECTVNANNTSDICKANETIINNNLVADSIENTISTMENSMNNIIPTLYTSITDTKSALNEYVPDSSISSNILRTIAISENNTVEGLSKLFNRDNFDNIEIILKQKNSDIIASDRYDKIKKTVDKVEELINRHKNGTMEIMETCGINNDNFCNKSDIEIIKSEYYT